MTESANRVGLHVTRWRVYVYAYDEKLLTGKTSISPTVCVSSLRAHIPQCLYLDAAAVLAYAPTHRFALELIFRRHTITLQPGRLFNHPIDFADFHHTLTDQLGNLVILDISLLIALAGSEHITYGQLVPGRTLCRILSPLSGFALCHLFYALQPALYVLPHNFFGLK